MNGFARDVLVNIVLSSRLSGKRKMNNSCSERCCITDLRFKQ